MATALVVKNLSSVSITVNTFALTANGGTHAFTTADFVNVFKDLQFRMGILLGTITFSIAGGPFFPSSVMLSSQLAHFIDGVIAGSVVIP